MFCINSPISYTELMYKVETIRNVSIKKTLENKKKNPTTLRLNKIRRYRQKEIIVQTSFSLLTNNKPLECIAINIKEYKSNP